jgi:hypothetical protein
MAIVATNPVINDWLKRQGVDPAKCTGVNVRMEPGNVVTAHVSMTVDQTEIESLPDIERGAWSAALKPGDDDYVAIKRVELGEMRKQIASKEAAKKRLSLEKKPYEERGWKVVVPGAGLVSRHEAGLEPWPGWLDVAAMIGMLAMLGAVL